MTLLLDTCALLWLAEGNKRLSERARKRISLAPAVFVCAISGWEIALKASQGKLTLPMPAGEWLDAVLAHHDLSVARLDLSVCVRAIELPPIHRDPCDRFIIAMALTKHWPVVTADLVFQDYGVEVIQVGVS